MKLVFIYCIKLINYTVNFNKIKIYNVLFKKIKSQKIVIYYV